MLLLVVRIRGFGCTGQVSGCWPALLDLIGSLDALSACKKQHAIGKTAHALKASDPSEPCNDSDALRKAGSLKPLATTVLLRSTCKRSYGSQGSQSNSEL